MRLNLFFSFVVTFLLVSLLAREVNALGLSSERVVFNEESTVQTVTVTNNSAIEQNYTAGWAHYIMEGEYGVLKPLPPDEKVAGVNWASERIKIEPQEFTLAPNSSKEVTLTAKPAKETVQGEYRAHFQVKSNTKEKHSYNEGKINIVTYAGVLKPVFIRYGKFAAAAKIQEVTITPLNIEDNGYQLEFNIERTGNRSLYGDIALSCAKEDGSDGEVLKAVSGIAVYTELEKKRVKLGFNIAEDLKQHCANIKLEYRSINEDPLFVGKIMDSVIVPLNNN